MTLRGLGEFRAVHTSLPFDEKGLSHTYNQLVKLSGKDVAIKFHDKHMGSVIELERVVSGTIIYYIKYSNVILKRL